MYSHVVKLFRDSLYGVKRKVVTWQFLSLIVLLFDSQVLKSLEQRHCVEDAADNSRCAGCDPAE